MRAEVAAMAGAQLFAPELPLVPAYTLTLALTRGPRWERAGGAFGGWLGLGYQYPGLYQGEAVGADVQTASVRAGVSWEIQSARVVLIRVGLGAGMDRLHYRPRGGNATVTLAQASSFNAPVASLWTGVELRLLDWLALTTRIAADAALTKIHFDLHEEAGQTSQVLVPYAVRPTFVIGLALVD